VFIGRKLDGSIYGSWTSRQADDAFHPLQEEVADDHPDLVAFLTPSPRSILLAQLAEIDRLTMIGVRGLREFIISQGQLTDYLINGGPLPVPGPLTGDNLGMQKVMQLEAQAVLLRAQLAALP